jgi:hypothetical protein
MPYKAVVDVDDAADDDDDEVVLLLDCIGELNEPNENAVGKAKDLEPSRAKSDGAYFGLLLDDCGIGEWNACVTTRICTKRRHPRYHPLPDEHHDNMTNDEGGVEGDDDDA